jgi:phosphatidate cytidylyltransferase
VFVCVYALSHAPALLYLNLVRWKGDVQVPRADPSNFVKWEGSPVGLLIFLVVLVQVSDLLHFLWDRLVGRQVIAPKINATRTWEGLIGSACCAAVFSMMIHLVLNVTPFTWIGAGLMGLMVAIMASSGAMTMSAIKRDRGVHDFGTLVQGHAGVLDRIDSICFAAPIFFHITRFFLNNPLPVEHAAWLIHP